MNWQSLAECKKYNPRLWFPYYYQGMTRRRRVDIETKAKNICQVCPVRVACLSHALRNNEDEGIWGGLNPEERNRIKQRA